MALSSKLGCNHIGCYRYTHCLQRRAWRLLLHGSQICWIALS
ncbi:hypothetical protein CsSME_00006314 [Camellia sinensis var. sinensis]